MISSYPFLTVDTTQDTVVLVFPEGIRFTSSLFPIAPSIPLHVLSRPSPSRILIFRFDPSNLLLSQLEGSFLTSHFPESSIEFSRSVPTSSISFSQYTRRIRLGLCSASSPTRHLQLFAAPSIYQPLHHFSGSTLEFSRAGLPIRTLSLQQSSFVNAPASAPSGLHFRFYPNLHGRALSRALD